MYVNNWHFLKLYFILHYGIVQNFINKIDNSNKIIAHLSILSKTIKLDFLCVKKAFC